MIICVFVHSSISVSSNLFITNFHCVLDVSAGHCRMFHCSEDIVGIDYESIIVVVLKPFLQERILSIVLLDMLLSSRPFLHCFVNSKPRGIYFPVQVGIVVDCLANMELLRFCRMYDHIFFCISK